MTHVTSRLTTKTGISSGTLRSVIEYGLPVPFLHEHKLSYRLNSSGRLYQEGKAIIVANWSTVLTSCCSIDSTRPHRCCHLPSKVENVYRTPDVPYGYHGPPKLPLSLAEST